MFEQNLKNELQISLEHTHDSKIKGPLTYGLRVHLKVIWIKNNLFRLIEICSDAFCLYYAQITL